MNNGDSLLIRSLPDEWSFQRLKYIFDERKEINNPVKTDVLVSLTHDRGVILHSEKGSIGNKEKNDLTKYKLVYPGDLVVNSMNVIIGSSGLSKFYGLVSPVYYMLKPKDPKMDAKYFHYLFRSILFQKSLIGVGNGILEHRMRVPMDKLGSHRLPLPPSKEQELISRYLDKKTEQIDSLIEKIQKKIELLKEQRTSLINQCVTKGLDPDVEMKDSGVEWIGEIPKHWSLSRLDFLVSLFGRVGWKSLKSDEYVDDGYVFLSTPNIKNKDIDFENVNYITKERYEESPEIMLEEGNVLLVKDGSTLGITNIVRSLPRPSTVNSSIGVLKIKSKDISPDFLYWYLSGHYIQNIIQRIKGGMGVPHLFQSDIKKFFVLLPSRDEQEIISKFVNKETSKLDLITEKHHERIRLLKEYRQSFISSAVTGKVRVTEDMI